MSLPGSDSLSLSSFLSLSLFFSLWFRGIEGELKKRRNFRVQKSPTSSAGFKLSETLSLSPRGGRHHLFGFSAIPAAGSTLSFLSPGA